MSQGWVGLILPSSRRWSVCHTIWQMRTTLDIDDGLVEALLARYPGISKTEAIERAVRGYLEMGALSRLIELAGKVEIDDVSAELRVGDRRT